VLAAEGGIRQHRLGEIVGMDPSSMVAAIDDLEAQGLVERRRDPNDRRAYALYLTETGTETLARGRKIAREAHQDLLAPLDDEERKTFHELLLKLAVAGSEHCGPGMRSPARRGPAAGEH
jgi:DNA-binding MarR family transcriptional regulator